MVTPMLQMCHLVYIASKALAGLGADASLGEKPDTLVWKRAWSYVDRLHTALECKVCRQAWPQWALDAAQICQVEKLGLYCRL